MLRESKTMSFGSLLNRTLDQQRVDYCVGRVAAALYIKDEYDFGVTQTFALGYTVFDDHTK